MNDRNTKKIMTFVGVLTALSFLASQALAQRVIEFEEIVVEGRIQKPEAFYILQHANLNYEALNPKPSFMTELLETVEDDVF
jgi:hypothetical protein